MKFLKRKVVNLRNIAGSQVVNIVFPWINYLKEKWRLKARVRLANIRARKNPKKFFYISVSIMSFLLLINVGSLFIGRTKKETPDDLIVNIVKIDSVFTGMRVNNELAAQQREKFSELALTARKLSLELDSLMKIPNKSPNDSSEIKTKYRKMQIIYKTLNINTNGKD